MKRNILSSLGRQESTTEKTEVEVVEIFDDNGDSLVFELLSTIKHLDGNNYLILTPLVEDESKIDMEIPAEVFIMKKVVHDNGEELLEPLTDSAVVKKVYAKFREMNSEQYDFEDNGHSN